MAGPANPFLAAFAIIMPDEGVHSDDPSDPGGDTWYGLSRVAHPDIPWPPTIEQAQAIYAAQYWLANACDKLPWPLSLVVFDGEVNSGGEGAKALQEVLRFTGTDVDGDIGPMTLAAVSGKDPVELACLTSAKRAEWYCDQDNPLYCDGWEKRLFMNMWKAATAT